MTDRIILDPTWVEGGNLSSRGKEALAEMLLMLPQAPNRVWGPVFMPLMTRIVPSSVEVVLIRDGAVLLTYREDQFFVGWHTPGGYIGPREKTFEEVAKRIATNEIGCSVSAVIQEPIATFLKSDNPRFTDVANLILCRVESEPKEGRWFKEIPPDLLPLHREYWPVISKYL